MCTNSALVDSLECYMEDMVDCFEDFVKKSLVIITLAVGALVGMLVYLLKTMNERGRGSIRTSGGRGSAQIISGAENSAFRGSGLADVKNAHSAITRGQGYSTSDGLKTGYVYSEGRGHRVHKGEVFEDESRENDDSAITRGQGYSTSDGLKTGYAYSEGRGHRVRKGEVYEDESIENDEFADNTTSNYKSNASSRHDEYSSQENRESRYDSKDARRVRSSGSQFNVKNSMSPRSSSTRANNEMIDDQDSFETKRTMSNNSIISANRINSNTKLPLPKDGMRTSSKSCIVCPKSSSKCIRKTISSCGNCSASVVSSCEEVTRDLSETVCPRKISQLRKPCSNRSNCPSSRLGIPSLPTCNIPKRHNVMNTTRPCTKAVSNRYSCCSVCCDNDPR